MYAIKNGLIRVTQGVIVTMLLTIVVVLMAQIIARYIFQNPLVWSEELVLILLLWITFLGSALLLEARGHISIDFMVRLMPERLQKAIQIIMAALMVGFCATLLYGGWTMVQATSASITPGLKVSVAWHYGGTLVGGGLMLIFAVEQFIHCLRFSPLQSDKPVVA